MAISAHSIPRRLVAFQSQTVAPIERRADRSEITGGLGEQYLSAVRFRAKAHRNVHVASHVTRGGELPRARVQAQILSFPATVAHLTGND